VQKTGEAIEMPFGDLNWVGPRNRVLDGVPDHLRGMGKFLGLSVTFKSTGRCRVYAKTSEPTETSFGADSCGPKEPYILIDHFNDSNRQ